MSRLCSIVMLALSASFASGTTLDEWLSSGSLAESQFNSQKALQCYLAALSEKPNDANILQKVAQQYSDSIVDLNDREQKIIFAKKALIYAEKAVQLDPQNAVNVLSIAICHGELALYSNARGKIAYSRLVKEETDRALALDPNYAWAHHVLGRWNYEVASLSVPTQWVVCTVYGGLPSASMEVAIAELNRAAQLDPQEPAHRLELGFANLAAGNKAEAKRQFEVGLSMPNREKHDEAAKERARNALSRL